MFSGRIRAGARYCPSIEDKINRFGDKDGHQIFLEPEQKDIGRVYLNGFSSSLPAKSRSRRCTRSRTFPRACAADGAMPWNTIPWMRRSFIRLSQKVIRAFISRARCAARAAMKKPGRGIIAGINAALRSGRRTVHPRAFRLHRRDGGRSCEFLFWTNRTDYVHEPRGIQAFPAGDNADSRLKARAMPSE